MSVPFVIKRPVVLFGTLTVALAVVIASILLAEPALALSPSEIRGACKAEYQRWKKRAGYGAFAYSRTLFCGTTWENISMEAARRHALQLCRKQRKAKCEIIAENDNPSSYVQKIEQCGSSAGNVKIDACTFLIAHSRKGYDQAWPYHERARVYHDLGRTDLALADYNSALRVNKRHGWSLWGRARLRNGAFDFEHALSDARAALKFYSKGAYVAGYDYRQDAKELIGEIEFEMKRQRPDDNSRLCTLALTPKSVSWEPDPRYAIAVREAERRGLTVEKCRNLLDRKP